MDLNISEFLSAYKKLVVQFENAKTHRDLIKLLAESSGFKLAPIVLFNTDGTLKSFDVLHQLAHQHLELIIKENTKNPVVSHMLLLNIGVRENATRDMKVKNRVDDFEWFEKTFKHFPNSLHEVRGHLLKNNFNDLNWFIDHRTFEPWVDLKSMISSIRYETS